MIVTRPIRLLLCLLFVVAASALIGPQAAVASMRPMSSLDAPSMDTQPLSSTVVGQLFRDLVREKDQQRFLHEVTTWYSQETLERVLAAGDRDARRGAAIALGHCGDFSCNASLGLALRDQDPMVRRIASEALRAVRFRAGTRAQNETISRIFQLLAAGDPTARRQAIDLASELIAEAPDYAEAYNQRAIALYLEGRYTECIRDSRKAMELNPYHFDAASGLANCYLKLGRQTEALEAFRLAQQINPADAELRSAVLSLEQSAR